MPKPPPSQSRKVLYPLQWNLAQLNVRQEELQASANIAKVVSKEAQASRCAGREGLRGCSTARSGGVGSLEAAEAHLTQ